MNNNQFGKRQKLYTAGFYIGIIGFGLTLIWQFALKADISSEIIRIIYFLWMSLVLFCFIKGNLFHSRIAKVLFIIFLSLIGLFVVLISMLLLAYAFTG